MSIELVRFRSRAFGKKEIAITPEEAVFHPGFKRGQHYSSGYCHLKWRQTNRVGSPRLLERINWVLNIAERRQTVVPCHCGKKNPSRYIEVRTNSSGSVIGSRNDFYLYCEDCSKIALKMEFGIVSLEFYRIDDFRFREIRQWFIRELFYTLTGKRVKEIKPEMAMDFFHSGNFKF